MIGNSVQTKILPKRYAVLCQDSRAQLSPLTSEVTTINKCELRLQMRPSVDMPKSWSWSNEIKNVRPSVMSNKYHNFRYGTADSNEQEDGYTSYRHRRFMSAPEISNVVKPKSSHTLPGRPSRYSFDERQKEKSKKIAYLMKPEIIFKEDAMKNMKKMKEEQITKQNGLQVTVNEFLEKKNPPLPPESLRVQRGFQFKARGPIIKQKYNAEEENSNDENVINPTTAPLLQMFAHHTWYYQSKDSWRYLRVKDPDPLSVDMIFDKGEKQVKL